MDKFDRVIRKNVLSIKSVPAIPRSNQSGFISFEISFDNFSKYLNEIKSINTSQPIKCIIYDESVITCDSDVLLRQSFLQSIQNMNFLQVDFKLSESTFPLYNTIMDRLNWKHDNVSFLEMTVDRYPTEIKDLRLERAKGKLLLPEEQLLWQSDYVLAKLNGKVDPRVLEETDKLKYVVRHYVDGLERHYDFDKLTDFDKVVLTYHYIKDRDKLNIVFANSQTLYGADGLQHINRSEDNWESKPYGTYIRRKGVCEGQARLFRILLNNWDMQVDATTLHGSSSIGPHTWLGVVIDDKLYYCCTTQGGLFNKVNFVPDRTEYYPQIYQTSSLSNEDKTKIEEHIRKLRR